MNRYSTAQASLIFQPSVMLHSSTSSSSLLVVCLCARWCGTCRQYQPLFEAMQSEFAGRARLMWVDIEDEAELVGSLEVENFPTLLMAQGDEIRFFGPVLPHRKTLEQMIQKAIKGPLITVQDPALTAIARRCAQRHRV